MSRIERIVVSLLRFDTFFRTNFLLSKFPIWKVKKKDTCKLVVSYHWPIFLVLIDSNFEKKKKNSFCRNSFYMENNRTRNFVAFEKKKTRNSFTFVQRDDKNSLFEMECGRTNISAEKRKKKGRHAIFFFFLAMERREVTTTFTKTRWRFSSKVYRYAACNSIANPSSTVIKRRGTRVSHQLCIGNA